MVVTSNGARRATVCSATSPAPTISTRLAASSSVGVVVPAAVGLRGGEPREVPVDREQGGDDPLGGRAAVRAAAVRERDAVGQPPDPRLGARGEQLHQPQLRQPCAAPSTSSSVARNGRDEHLGGCRPRAAAGRRGGSGSRARPARRRARRSRPRAARERPWLPTVLTGRSPRRCLACSCGGSQPGRARAAGRPAAVGGLRVVPRRRPARLARQDRGRRRARRPARGGAPADPGAAPAAGPGRERGAARAVGVRRPGSAGRGDVPGAGRRDRGAARRGVGARRRAHHRPGAAGAAGRRPRCSSRRSRWTPPGAAGSPGSCSRPRTPRTSSSTPTSPRRPTTAW